MRLISYIKRYSEKITSYDIQEDFFSHNDLNESIMTIVKEASLL